MTQQQFTFTPVDLHEDHNSHWGTPIESFHGQGSLPTN